MFLYFVRYTIPEGVATPECGAVIERITVPVVDTSIKQSDPTEEPPLLAIQNDVPVKYIPADEVVPTGGAGSLNS